jgi:hypothetical protein
MHSLPEKEIQVLHAGSSKRAGMCCLSGEPKMGKRQKMSGNTMPTLSNVRKNILQFPGRSEHGGVSPNTAKPSPQINVAQN